MTEITLYRHKREDGGVTVTTVKPSAEHTTLSRLVADEGKMLTRNGVVLYAAVDTDNTEGWYEVEAPDTETVI